MAKNLGQYSIVSYVHELRGERVNVGVLVWHPLFGCVFRRSSNLARVRTIDESVDLSRVRSALERINETAKTWPKGDESPLQILARQFRRRLVVTPPLNARIQDPPTTLERLSASLLPPEPFMRASPTNRFGNFLARGLRKELERRGISEFRSDFFEEGTFEPVKVTASYSLRSENHLWRAFSFASRNNLNEQLTLAKAVHAENTELKKLQKYRDAHLFVAVQMPKPQARADWDKAVRWLRRESKQVVDFEDQKSIEAKVPELLPPDLSPALSGR